MTGKHLGHHSAIPRRLSRLPLRGTLPRAFRRQAPLGGHHSSLLTIMNFGSTVLLGYTSPCRMCVNITHTHNYTDGAQPLLESERLSGGWAVCLHKVSSSCSFASGSERKRGQYCVLQVVAVEV